MITVVFFTEEEIVVGNGFSTVLTRHEIKTGKTTMEEAYDVAVANGHNPENTIHFVVE